jgi:TPP-dependent indolepyruvate ferredoxin oxidoreductase alpha subunit
MSFEQAIELATREERFMATVYAMNTLLVHKGIYTQEEFERLFVEWTAKEQRKNAKNARAAKPSLCEA